MRPNEWGGQTLENHYEIETTSASLFADKRDGLGGWVLIAPSSIGVESNIHPDLQAKKERVVELNAGDTMIALKSLKKAAAGRVIVDRSHQFMAQSMIARLEDKPFEPKAYRLRRGLTRIRSFLSTQELADLDED